VHLSDPSGRLKYWMRESVFFTLDSGLEAFSPLPPSGASAVSSAKQGFKARTETAKRVATPLHIFDSTGLV